MSLPLKSVSIKIIGLVQGVGYRASTLKRATQLNLKGFVRNEADGSVYIEAEGLAIGIQELITWCHQGPKFAKVSEVIVNEVPQKSFTDFEVR
jgi:acylphosphatase